MEKMDEKGISMLIVDDEQELAQALARRFQKLGFAVKTAGGGNEAFKMFKESPVDVVLTDIRMPQGTGIELIENLGKLDLSLKPVIICMSAFTDLTEEGAKARGASALLVKPVDLTELVNVIQHFYFQRKQYLSSLEAKKIG